jgi:hypothetical protein
MNDEPRLQLYEQTIRVTGKLMFSRKNAEWFKAQRTIDARPD